MTKLHGSAISVDLFDPDPAHAFAGVTALAGAMVIVLVSYSAATDPTTFENPTWIAFTIVSVIVAAFAFFLPLLEMRRRLKQQKVDFLAASTKRVRRVAAEIDVAVDDGRYQDVPQFKAALEALERDREATAKTSTWPWDAGTLSRFVPTLLLALILWLITNVLGRLLDL